MIQIRRGIRPEEVRADGEHVLFVEGKDDGALDQAVLRALLGNRLRIAAMGDSYHVRSAAQALVRHHSKYCFLIDEIIAPTISFSEAGNASTEPRHRHLKNRWNPRAMSINLNMRNC